MGPLSGATVAFLLGGRVPVPAPKAFVRAIDEVEVVQGGTPTGRDAFRIVNSYARYARESEAKDFPIARDNLGERLGITGRGAGKIREKLAAFGIIRLVQNYRPNRAAARYVWTANECARENRKQT